jgi:hypothetical protein
MLARSTGNIGYSSQKTLMMQKYQYGINISFKNLSSWHHSSE